MACPLSFISIRCGQVRNLFNVRAITKRAQEVDWKGRGVLHPSLNFTAIAKVRCTYVRAYVYMYIYVCVYIYNTHMLYTYMHVQLYACNMYVYAYA